MSQIKYEYKNRNMLFPKSYPIAVDLDTAKLVFKYCYLTDQLNGLQGFIQDTFYDPFGFVLMSQIQVFNLKNIELKLKFDLLS